MRINTFEGSACQPLTLSLSLSLSLTLQLSPTHYLSFIAFMYFLCRPLATAFYSCRRLDVVAAARTATHACWVSSHVGWRLRLWQDIGNAQGCLYMRNHHGFMVAS